MATHNEVIRLSIIDSFYSSRNYMHVLTGYSLKTLGSAGADLLVDMIRNLVSETITQYPVLAGTVQLDPEAHGMRVVAHMPAAGAGEDIDPGTSTGSQAEILKVVRQGQHTPKYDELQASNFHPSKFDVASLSPFPNATPPLDTPTPVFGAQVNIIEGGILIVFQLHHTIADGRTMGQLFNYMCSLLEQKQSEVPPMVFHVPDFEDGTELGEPHKLVQDCPERVLVGAVGGAEGVTSPAREHRPPEGERGAASQALLITSISRVDTLYEQCTKALEEAGITFRISKNDVLGAFLWSYITSARHSLGSLPGTSHTSCHIPVDIRKRVSPEITDSYFGSAVLTVSARQVVKTVVDATLAYDANHDALPIAKLACLIRQSINQVDTAFVKRRHQLALSVEASNLSSTNASEQRLQIKHVFDPFQHCDVVFSTLSPIFDMQGAAMQMVRPDFMRPLHHVEADGVVDVVASLDSARIEMTIKLEKGVLEAMRERKRWVEVVERTAV
jgi:hypothetical protein